jgi:hypothetical protein
MDCFRVGVGADHVVDTWKSPQISEHNPVTWFRLVENPKTLAQNPKPETRKPQILKPQVKPWSEALK